jgi:hypothetical protein
VTGERDRARVPSRDEWGAVEDHLRRLDASSLRALVVDLWTARGFETERDGAAVVASRGGSSQVVLPVPAGRIDRLRSSSRRPAREPGRGSGPGSGSGSAPDPDDDRRGTDRDRDRRADGSVDVVVAPGGSETVPASASDARVVDAAGLRRALRYAVDRRTARTLSATHLGAPPDRLRPSLRGRLSARAREVGSIRWPGVAAVRSLVGSADSPRPAASVVVAVVVVVVVVGSVAGSIGGLGLAGGTADVAAGAGDDPSGLDSTSGAGDTGEGGGTTAGGGSDGAGGVVADGEPTRVPGLTSAGIANLTSLALAHERALVGRSYALRLERFRPRGGIPTARRVKRTTNLTVTPDRYLATTTVDTNGDSAPVRVVYHEGTDFYVADSLDADADVRRLPTTDAPPSVRPDPARLVMPSVLQSTLVFRYLSTPESTLVDRTRVGRRVRYRVVGRGVPRGLARDDVRDYSFAAVVAEDGLVREAEVEFVVETEGWDFHVRLEWTYDRTGPISVDRPPWVDEERRSEDPAGGTGTGSGPERDATNATAPPGESAERGGHRSAPGERPADRAPGTTARRVSRPATNRASDTPGPPGLDTDKTGAVAS